MYAMQRRGPNRCVKALWAGDVGVGRMGMLSCLVKFSLVPGEIHASRLQLADLGHTVGTLPRLRHQNAEVVRRLWRPALASTPN